MNNENSLNTNELAWPPQYTVRHSQRAKSIFLTMNRFGELEIVVPKLYKKAPIETILNEKRAWIERNFCKTLPKKPSEVTTPTYLSLKALNEEWKIECQTTLGKRFKIIERPMQQLVLMLPTDFTITETNKLLQQWLKKYARRHLINRLETLSQMTGLSFQKGIIRGQTSRWGSCSADKVISLNYKLLFLPASLVDYILIHELCHTRHLNHSQRFWALVAKFQPDVMQLRRECRKAQCYIPHWIEVI